MSLFYCYGIIEEKESHNSSHFINSKGFEDSKIYTIPFKDIAAVVSDVSEAQFSQESVDKNIKDMKWLTANAPTHEKVVDTVRKETTIVPMTFCTIFKTKEKVLTMMEEKYADLTENLQRISGKVEMGVKVYADIKKMKEELTSPEIENLEKEKQQKTPGAAYFVQQKIDSIINEKIQKHISSAAKTMIEKLSNHTTDRKKNPLLREKEMVLNAAFLITTDEVEKWKQIVESTQTDFSSFQIKITGPFTPYNFVR